MGKAANATKTGHGLRKWKEKGTITANEKAKHYISCQNFHKLPIFSVEKIEALK